MTSATPPAAPLARRLTRRAIDLLVVSFLAMVGISTGQQLIEWWRIDPAESAPDLSNLNIADLDWSRTPVTLRFGNASTSLERIPFQGTPKALDDELTKVGQGIVSSCEVLTTVMDDAEREWLESLQLVPPVFWDSPLGNVYRRRQPLPSFVATRFVEPDPKIEDGVAERIVGWGLAFPTAPGNWIIYVFHPSTAKHDDGGALPSLELPKGAQNITDLGGQDGTRWRVIQGRGNVAGWVQHFDTQLGTAISRAVAANDATLKYRRDQVMTDIQIRTEPDGRLTAVIWSAKERDHR